MDEIADIKAKIISEIVTKMDEIIDIKSKIISELKLVNRTGMEQLISYLVKSDFFTCPASTKFHSNFDGGLALHSWSVYKLFKEKIKFYNLTIPLESIIISGLLHDICKINFYFKNEHKENNWDYKDWNPLGHAEKSIIMLQDYILLTETEKYLIRWHMGFSEEMGYIQKMTYYRAIELCPAIVLLFTADFESSTFLEKTLPVVYTKLYFVGRCCICKKDILSNHKWDYEGHNLKHNIC